MREIIKKIALIWIYLIILIFLKSGFNFFKGLILLIVGGTAGILLLETDYFLYAWVMRPDDPISFEVRRAAEKKDLKGVINGIKRIKESREEFILHSYLFAPIIFGLALFALTSSGSYLGSGVTLGLYGAYLLDTYESFKKYLKDGSFKKRLFWNLSGFNITEKMQKFYISAILSGWVVLTAVFLR